MNHYDSVIRGDVRKLHLGKGMSGAPVMASTGARAPSTGPGAEPPVGIRGAKTPLKLKAL